jgi:hypothetical protein
VNQIRYPCPGCGATQEILLGPLATLEDREGRPPCPRCLAVAPPLPQQLGGLLCFGSVWEVRAARVRVMRLPWAEAWIREGSRLVTGLRLGIWQGADVRRFTRRVGRRLQRELRA